MKLDKATVIRVAGWLMVIGPVVEAVGRAMSGQHVDWSQIMVSLMMAAGGTQVAPRAGDASAKNVEAKVEAKVAERMRSTVPPGAV